MKNNVRPYRGVLITLFALLALGMGQASVAGEERPGEEAHNPKVLPGKVHWHPDLEAACRASRKTGKPVLLFQLMGKLDERFC